MASSHFLPTRPKIFVESASAADHIVGFLGAGLADVADVTTSCDGIAEASRTFDFAVFVLGDAQDVGMLLRLGVFLGALGRERVVIVCPAARVRDLPSELRDVTLATYAAPSDGNADDALGSVCATLKEHVRRLTTATHAGSSLPSALDAAS